MARARDQRRRAWGCGVLLLAPLLYYAAQAAFRTEPLGELQVIAHRGGARHAPENTLAAFHNAVVQGSNSLEFDVQMTRDGALVVIHDETVDRTTNGTGAVSDLPLAEIRTLDAGDGERVPTLDEVAALAKEGEEGVLPEAKSPHLYPGLETAMLQSLQESGVLEHAIIQSFDPASLQRFRELDGGVQLCALYSLGGFDLRSPPRDAQYVCPMAEMALLYPAMIRQAHEDGRQVYIWFLAIENPSTLRFLRFFGADGFIVDDPAAALQAIGR
jgi:glycerophosphoryl diester phosphodiesterase